MIVKKTAPPIYLSYLNTNQILFRAVKISTSFLCFDLLPATPYLAGDAYYSVYFYISGKKCYHLITYINSSFMHSCV
jgi:hypothetical protein